MLSRLYNRIADLNEQSAALTMLRGIFRVLSWLFGVAVILRDYAYTHGILPAVRLPVKVVSVGGITAGGAGKTPVVRYLARRLSEAGERVVILSRGYGGRASGVAVVSDETDIRLSAHEAGDEPVMLATALTGIPVVIGADRAQAGRRAIEQFGATALLLDDAFQHRRVRRDLDVVVLDATAPAGNGHLLPAGPLRESLRALRRAHVVALTRTDQSGDITSIRDRIRSVNSKAPVIECVYRPVRLRRLSDSEIYPVAHLKEARVVTVSGIANPASFERTVEQLGMRAVATFRFPDHHAFSISEWEEIIETASTWHAGWIVTTEKDAVRIPDHIDRSRMVAIDIEIEVVKGEEKLIAECGMRSAE